MKRSSYVSLVVSMMAASAVANADAVNYAAPGFDFTVTTKADAAGARAPLPGVPISIYYMATEYFPHAIGGPRSVPDAIMSQSGRIGITDAEHGKVVYPGKQIVGSSDYTAPYSFSVFPDLDSLTMEACGPGGGSQKVSLLFEKADGSPCKFTMTDPSQLSAFPKDLACQLKDTKSELDAKLAAARLNCADPKQTPGVHAESIDRCYKVWPKNSFVAKMQGANSMNPPLGAWNAKITGKNLTEVTPPAEGFGEGQIHEYSGDFSIVMKDMFGSVKLSKSEAYLRVSIMRASEDRIYAPQGNVDSIGNPTAAPASMIDLSAYDSGMSQGQMGGVGSTKLGDSQDRYLWKKVDCKN